MSTSLEDAYFKKDLAAFNNAVQKARANNTLDAEYNNNTLSDHAFKRGSALTSIVALSPFDPHSTPYVQALLEAGADPNHINITLGGLTPLQNLIRNAEPHFVYADPETLADSLKNVIELLVSYGADISPYQGRTDSQVASTIDQVLADIANEIESEKDLRVLHARFCQELSNENNIANLRLIAKGLGLPTTGKKSELCNTISQYIISNP